MQKRNAFLGLSLFAATIGVPAALAAQAQPIVLWGEFTTASTASEIKAYKAQWPKKRPEVIPGCPSEMGYRTAKGQMVTISLLGQDRDADCFNRLRAKYEAELGEPEYGTAPFGSTIGYALGPTSTGVMLIWREGDKKTKLIKSPGNGYNLFFTVREDKYLY